MHIFLDVAVYSSRQGPVPNSTIVSSSAHSAHCGVCHAHNRTGIPPTLLLSLHTPTWTVPWATKLLVVHLSGQAFKGKHSVLGKKNLKL